MEDRIYSNYGLHDMQNPDNGRILRNLNIAAVNAYSSLAELSISKEKYGRALRFLKIALQAIGRFNSGLCLCCFAVRYPFYFLMPVLTRPRPISLF